MTIPSEVAASWIASIRSPSWFDWAKTVSMPSFRAQSAIWASSADRVVVP